MKFLKDERLWDVLMGLVRRNNEQLFSFFIMIKNQDAKNVNQVKTQACDNPTIRYY